MTNDKSDLCRNEILDDITYIDANTSETYRFGTVTKLPEHKFVKLGQMPNRDHPYNDPSWSFKPCTHLWQSHRAYVIGAGLIGVLLMVFG